MALTPEPGSERVIGFEALDTGNAEEQRQLDEVERRSDAESFSGEMEPWALGAVVPANFNGLLHAEVPKFSYMLRSFVITTTGLAFTPYQGVIAVGYEPNVSIMATVFSKKSTLIRTVFNAIGSASSQVSHTFTPGRGLLIRAGKALNFLHAANGSPLYSTELSIVLYVERVKGVK